MTAVCMHACMVALQVEIIRRVLSELDSKLAYLHSMSSEEVDALKALVAKAGEDFLK